MKHLITLFAFIFFGCGHSIHEGKIVERIYQPERRYTYTTVTYINKIPIIHYHSGIDHEDFILVVKGKNKEGEFVEENFFVDKMTFECLQIGDYFNDTIPCSREDQNNKTK